MDTTVLPTPSIIPLHPQPRPLSTVKLFFKGISPTLLHTLSGRDLAHVSNGGGVTLTDKPLPHSRCLPSLPNACLHDLASCSHSLALSTLVGKGRQCVNEMVMIASQQNSISWCMMLMVCASYETKAGLSVGVVSILREIFTQFDRTLMSSCVFNLVRFCV